MAELLAALAGNDSMARAFIESFMPCIEGRPQIRGYVIQGFARGMKADEWLRILLERIAKQVGEKRVVRFSAIETLARHWSKSDKVSGMLCKMALNSREKRHYRECAVDALGASFGKLEAVKDLLLKIAGDNECDQGVRCHAIQALEKNWGGAEWLRVCLNRIALDKETDESPGDDAWVRVQSIQTLCDAGPHDDLKILLEHVVTDPIDDSDVRIASMNGLMLLWSRDVDLRDIVQNILEREDEDFWLRKNAVIKAIEVWKNSQDWLRSILEPLVIGDNKNASLRNEVIEHLGTAFGQQEWVRALLVSIAANRHEALRQMSVNSDFFPQVMARAKAIQTLEKTWGCQSWLRDFLERLAYDLDEQESTRVNAITALCRSQDWSRDNLAAILYNKKEHSYLTCALIDSLVYCFRDEPDWLREFFLRSVTDEDEDGALRAKALKKLSVVTGAQLWFKELLEKLLATSHQNLEVIYAAQDELKRLWSVKIPV